MLLEEMKNKSIEIIIEELNKLKEKLSIIDINEWKLEINNKMDNYNLFNDEIDVSFNAKFSNNKNKKNLNLVLLEKNNSVKCFFY